MSNKEKDTFSSHEAFDAKQLENVQSEQQERLKENLERSVETQSKERLEDARKEALEQASKNEKEQKPVEKETSPAERRGPLTKREKDASFNNTMNEIRTHMSAPSRMFSHIIHNKVVEKVSDIAGATIARPNAILFGSIFAFILTLAVYLVANHNGYALSGSETIASFALGWVIGLLIDYIRVLVFGKSQ